MSHQRFCASIMDLNRMYGVLELYCTFYLVVFLLTGQVCNFVVLFVISSCRRRQISIKNILLFCF